MIVNNLDKSMVSITRMKRSNWRQLKVRERTTKLIHWTTTISMAALFLLHSLVMEKKTWRILEETLYIRLLIYGRSLLGRSIPSFISLQK